MGQIPGWLYRQAGQTITIEAYEGTGPFGDIYRTAAVVRAIVDDTRRLIRAADGSEVVSETTVLVPLATDAPQGSRVTIADRTATVLRASRVDGQQLPVPSHLELALT